MLTKIDSVLQRLRHKYRLRRLILHSKGRNVQISHGFNFHESQNIAIGDDVYIGPHSFISAIGGVDIGSGTIIGPRVTIYSANHRYEGANAIPYDDVILPGKVNIGENIWIGCNVIILPGVKIGEGCIIGAGSVVTREMPSFKVIGGNPARVLKNRDERQYLKLKQEERIYLALKIKGQMRPHLETPEDW